MGLWAPRFDTLFRERALGSLAMGVSGRFELTVD